MGANEPRDVANLDPRGMIGRNFLCSSYHKPLADNDAPWAWPIWTPRGIVGRIYKGDY